MSKRQYEQSTGRSQKNNVIAEQSTGRSQKNNVIAYQIRQSFKPGEITPEEANKVGYELAMRFTKGKHAFIVATHTDRQHIHNHILYNSTSMDGSRKFRDFWLSGLAVQRLSDVICLEHKLSVIETKPYRERQKRILYPPRESNRDRLCAVIDNILRDKPSDFEAFLQKLEQEGYEVKRGKHTSVKGKRQKRFIRFRTLGSGYSEEEIRAVLDGKAEHRPRQRPAGSVKEDAFQLLIDLAAKRGRGAVYQRWAKKFNLKEMSKTLIFLQENKLTNMDELNSKVESATKHFHELQETIRAVDKRMAEITELRTQIIHYAKTRDVYAAYRKAGYSKQFRTGHEAEILLHQAAKEFFDKLGLKKLPKVKELNAEYAELLHRKISSDSSQMRHRSRTGSRAGKRNTPKVDFASAFGVFFRFYGMEAFCRNAQSASGGCSLERVWEVPNKHFCTGPEGHGAKIADWYQSALLAHSALRKEA